MAGAASEATCTPVVADGGIEPVARRTRTRAKSASPGLIHDRATLDDVVAVTSSPVTGPGGVLSGAGGVVVVAVAAVAWLGTASWANRA